MIKLRMRLWCLIEANFALRHLFHLVAVDRVVEIRAAVVLSDPVANYLVALEGIVLPLCRAPALTTGECVILRAQSIA